MVNTQTDTQTDSCWLVILLAQPQLTGWTKTYRQFLHELATMYNPADIWLSYRVYSYRYVTQMLFARWRQHAVLSILWCWIASWGVSWHTGSRQYGGRCYGQCVKICNNKIITRSSYRQLLASHCLTEFTCSVTDIKYFCVSCVLCCYRFMSSVPAINSAVLHVWVEEVVWVEFQWVICISCMSTTLMIFS